MKNQPRPFCSFLHRSDISFLIARFQERGSMNFVAWPSCFENLWQVCSYTFSGISRLTAKRSKSALFIFLFFAFSVKASSSISPLTHLQGKGNRARKKSCRVVTKTLYLPSLSERLPSLCDQGMRVPCLADQGVAFARRGHVPDDADLFG